jgi:acyl carrier protein
MNNPKPEEVRQFLINNYAEAIRASGRDLESLPDDFDFLLEGIIDSFGILEMVGAIENEFNVTLDLADLDAEQMTVLGPLSHYVAGHVLAQRD